jgi:hypothetical protein
MTDNVHGKKHLYLDWFAGKGTVGLTFLGSSGVFLQPLDNSRISDGGEPFNITTSTASVNGSY